MEAYNEKSETTKISVIRTDVPENLFIGRSYEKAYIGIFTEFERWVIRLNENNDEIRYKFGRLKTNITDYKDMEEAISPFNINASMLKKNNESLYLHFLSGGSQEQSYLSDGFPETAESNIVAKHLIIKIVELLLLPSIKE